MTKQFPNSWMGKLTRRASFAMFTMLVAGFCAIASAPAQTTADWPMFGGNPAHTGTNDLENGVPPLTLDWAVPLTPTVLNPVTIEGNRVFVTGTYYFNPEAWLWALNTADGTLAWRYNFGSVFSVNPPGVSEGLVYVQMGNHTPSSRLFAFNAADGTIAWTSPFEAQWERYYSPTIADGKVFVDAGYYGGIYGYDAATGARLFANTAVEQYDQWTPAYDAGVVYSFVQGNLRAHDPTTGATLWTNASLWIWDGWSMYTCTVIGGGKAYVINRPNLTAVDLTTHTVSWVGNDRYTSTAAYNDGVVYAISGGELHARDAASGTLLWTFIPTDPLKYPPVIANGFAYVSGNTTVYAVDLTNGVDVWSDTTAGGWLSIADGRLYVAGGNGTLAAYKMSTAEPEQTTAQP
jgi:outer membrane protein assembly factor BamB